MFWKKKNKKYPKGTCGSCGLFNRANNTCRVNILMNGSKINIPCDPEDQCFFMEEFEMPDGKKERLVDDIQQVRMWVEDPVTGKQADKGVVRIEYPDGFFGKESPGEVQ